MKILTKIVPALLALALVSGRAMFGGNKDKVAAETKDTGSDLESTKAYLTDLQTSINALLVDNAPLSDVYPDFSKQVEKVEKSAEKMKANAVALKKAGKDKHEAWRQEAELIQDEKMRKESIKLMETSLKEHEKLLNLLAESETVMDPLVTDLSDIQKFLNLQLTHKSVKEVSGQLKKAYKEATAVKKWISEVQSELTAKEK